MRGELEVAVREVPLLYLGGGQVAVWSLPWMTATRMVPSGRGSVRTTWATAGSEQHGRQAAGRAAATTTGSGGARPGRDEHVGEQAVDATAKNVTSTTPPSLASPAGPTSWNA